VIQLVKLSRATVELRGVGGPLLRIPNSHISGKPRRMVASGSSEPPWLFSSSRPQYACHDSSSENHGHHQEAYPDSPASHPPVFELSMVLDNSRQRGRSHQWRRSAIVLGGMACCMAISMFAAASSRGRGGGHRTVLGESGIPLVGQNTFVFKVPEDSTSESANPPSWDQMKNGNPASSPSSLQPSFLLPPLNSANADSSSHADSDSLGDAFHKQHDNKGSGSGYDGFLKALLPASDQDDDSSARSIPQDEFQGNEPDRRHHGREGETHPEHRSATVVVHRLSSEFDRRFHDSTGAYDFCIRDKLTHEELAECIKHMLMKSSPDYKPSEDQGLLDKVSVLKLQIREEQSQSARAIRKLRDRVQELHMRLLTAVPYEQFKELRKEYETKLRALQRLVVRFTHDMAMESHEDNGEKYGDTAHEVANALGDRLRSSEDDVKIKALWRMLGRRVQQVSWCSPIRGSVTRSLCVHACVRMYYQTIVCAKAHYTRVCACTTKR
jgi:hypothetical protein